VARKNASRQADSDTAQIHVEKSIASSRSGRFELVAQYDPKAGLPFQAALRNLVR
jgi:hypothetical protein